MSYTSWELKETPCYDLLNDCQDFNYKIVTGDWPIALLGKEAKAHGETIINAVNSHQAMKEALEAIIARIDGAFDHPSLLKQGPLSIGHNDDVRKIAKQALTLANGGSTDE